MTKGSRKLGKNIFKDPTFGWTRNIYKNKICGYCKKCLNYSNFRVHNKSTSAYKIGAGFIGEDFNLHFSTCRKCEATKSEIKYEKNPFPQMFSNAKIRAKKKNLPFNITAEYLKKIWPKDNKCPVLRIKFVMGYKTTRGKSKNFAPSLDKIEPKKGYVKGNVIVVSDLVNRMKQDASLEQLEQIYKFFSKYKQNVKKYLN